MKLLVNSDVSLKFKGQNLTFGTKKKAKTSSFRQVVQLRNEAKIKNFPIKVAR